MSHSKVGVVGYGVYIPWERIETAKIVREQEKKRGKELEKVLEKVRHGLLLREKALAGHTEDTITIATEAAENALRMSGISPDEIGSVTAGSESKPYAVGTIARHVASFVGVGENVFIADLEGACNSGMQGIGFIDAEIRSGRIKYGLALGSDVAQAERGDPLELSAGAGAGAYVLGKTDLIATIEDMAPYSSLFMDFWRREQSPVPKHFGRTTVEAYKSHVIGAIANLFRKHPDLVLSEFDAITFHQPSGYLPMKTVHALTEEEIPYVKDSSIAERMRLTEQDIEKKIKPWLRVLDTGNTYAASTLISLASIFDNSEPGDRVLAVSYGSGAYSNATWFEVQDGIEKKRGRTPTVEDYIKRKAEIKIESYQDLVRERLSRIKKRLEIPRIIGEIEPVNGKGFSVSLCHGCNRIYYPARETCLDSECAGPMEARRYPLIARLKSVAKLPLKRRFTSNFELLEQNKVLLVDARISDLKLGIKLEGVIRRLDYEGKDGLIMYGIAYRPVFKEALALIAKPKLLTVGEAAAQYA
ncbi:MAG TPA: hydroxymethylglutaryl-CoA synthase [Candidatus Bathyarchaeia archaeon]|nr:hydroxymethylglutaryl-CoA synthase [Candidatus Bathyarchaeia archaeon]